MLLDPKRETFCQAYLETNCQSEAFRRAHPRSLNWQPKTVHEKASRMMADDKVQARLQEMQEQTAERNAKTRDDIAEMLDKVYTAAFADKQYSPAVSSAMGLAKLLGHIVEKAEIAGKDGAPAIELVLTSRTRTPQD